MHIRSIGFVYNLQALQKFSAKVLKISEICKFLTLIMYNNLTILISLLPETTVNPFNILDFFSGLYAGGLGGSSLLWFFFFAPKKMNKNLGALGVAPLFWFLFSE